VRAHRRSTEETIQMRVGVFVQVLVRPKAG
jgi:hypothetical protein